MTSSVYSDYVTLYIKDVYDSSSQGKLVWKIPPDAYYHKDKGLLCKVSLADAALQTSGSGDQNISINYVGSLTGGLNEQVAATAVENFAGTLGILTYNSNINWYSGQSGSEPIKLLTSARPDKIALTFVEGSKVKYDFDLSGGQDGIFVLRFDYFDPIAEKQINYDVSYKPAFPNPKDF